MYTMFTQLCPKLTAALCTKIGTELMELMYTYFPGVASLYREVDEF